MPQEIRYLHFSMIKIAVVLTMKISSPRKNNKKSFARQDTYSVTHISDIIGSNIEDERAETRALKEFVTV